jgi:hypothetical protein
LDRARGLARPRLGDPAGDYAPRAARPRAKLEIAPGRRQLGPEGA